MQGYFHFWIVIVGIAAAVFLLSGRRIVRPTRRGLIERLGKYLGQMKTASEPGMVLRISAYPVLCQSRPEPLDKLRISIKPP